MHRFVNIKNVDDIYSEDRHISWDHQYHHHHFFNPLFVTICPETFSNLCVDSVRDM